MNRLSRTGITRSSGPAKPRTASSRKSAASPDLRRAVVGELAQGLPERFEHFARVAGVEKLDRRGVAPLDERDVHRPEESRHGHPEIVAHQHEGLDAPAVALPQRPDELGVGLVEVGLEPLLELVEHQDQLCGRPARRRRRGAIATASGRLTSARKSRDLALQLGQQPRLGPAGGRLEVDRPDACPGRGSAADPP